MEIPLVCRLEGTVIKAILWQIFVICLYTASLVCIHNFAKHCEITFPQTLIPVIGVVVGLLLVFKTNASYDRYYEGRKIWSTMVHNIRALTRCIWVMVEETSEIKANSSATIIEKASAINLLIAFPYAVKHHLREEYSHFEEDIIELVRHLPRFSVPVTTGSWGERLQDFRKCVVCSQQCLVNFQVKPRSTASRTSSGRRQKSSHFVAFETTVPSNIPIELSYCISNYINTVRQRGIADSSTVSLMNASLNNLVDCLSGFERILRTPIPLAYTVHLHHAVWIYILALPFQLIGLLNWFTIPGVALAAFCILGILEIGLEIENPFGYDSNDLPLDDYCRALHKEILKIIDHPVPPADTWLLSEENYPLAPDSYLNAKELAKLEESEIREILTRGAYYSPSDEEVVKIPPSRDDNELGQNGADMKYTKSTTSTVAGLHDFKTENTDELSDISRNP